MLIVGLLWTILSFLPIDGRSIPVCTSNEIRRQVTAVEVLWDIDPNDRVCVYRLAALGLWPTIVDLRNRLGSVWEVGLT